MLTIVEAGLTKGIFILLYSSLTDSCLCNSLYLQQHQCNCISPKKKKKKIIS